MAARVGGHETYAKKVSRPPQGTGGTRLASSCLDDAAADGVLSRGFPAHRRPAADLAGQVGAGGRLPAVALHDARVMAR
jgi:hypothetical protein